MQAPAAGKVEPPPLAAPSGTAPLRAGEGAALVEQLRVQRTGRTNVFANVLAFVALLLAFVGFMRWWNAGKPKEGNMFGGGAPAAAGGGGEGAPVASGPGISGTVELGPNQQPAAGSTLFVIVRMGGTPDKGPPLAVKKIESPSFPARFQVGPGDEMIPGMPFNAPLDVYARLDRDGNAMTRDPDDLAALPIGGAAPGGAEVALILSRKIKDGDLPPPAPIPGAAPAPAPAAPPTPPAPPTPAAAPGAPIKGRVELDPSVASGAPTQGSLFVIVRMAGTPDRGPPVAVTKIDQPSFPVRFEIGPSDVMLQGMPFTGPFDVYARLDGDGNAMTRVPGDLELSAPKSPVKPGDSSIVLKLDRRR